VSGSVPATRRRASGRRVLFIAPEGLPFVGIGLVVALLAALVSVPVGIGLAVLALLVGAFFRDPDRAVPEGAGLVVAPADGKVVIVEPTPDGHYAGPGMTQISTFLSLLDVHVNRTPIEGTIGDVEYHPGSFLPAFNDKASLRNEQNRITVDGPDGRIVVTQIAGIVARRIVFRLRTGDAVHRGERIGLIRFGSRLDVFVPTGTDVKVSVGERVRAGASVLAVLPGATP
jgi:phosphatidylserine decarboxylase